MSLEKEVITISAEEYATLIEDSFRKCDLLNALGKAAELNYTEKGLRFDNDTLDTFLKCIFPAFYETTLIQAKRDAAEREKG